MTDTGRTVPCTYCGAPAGQPCHNELTNEPLANFDAHLTRQKNATQIEDEELPF